MWSKAKNAAGTAGLEIINPCNEPFDFRLHSIEGTDQDIDMSNGYVIKTLKYGYIYKDEIIRRAAVIVNKIETHEPQPSPTGESSATDNNIIYL
jgi:molecular chaperone GrpE (heat shock protein)